MLGCTAPQLLTSATSLDNPALMIPARLGGVEISVTPKNLVLTLNQVSGSIWILDNADR